MSEIVDKALALMLRHAANEASDYGDVRPATGFGPAVMRFDKESKTYGSTHRSAQSSRISPSR